MTLKDEKKSRLTSYVIVKIILILALTASYFFESQLLEKKWIAQLAKGIWTFLLPSITLSILRFVVLSIYNRRHSKNKVRSNFALAINQLTAVLNALFFIIAFMIGLGINPIEFLAGMTIVAMAIAVTFKDYITNMISGLLIMFSDQLSIGDRIKIGNEEGSIEDITLSNIVLINNENDIVMVPNNFFYTQPISNLSIHRTRFFYIKFELPLNMTQYVDELESDLKELQQQHPNIEKANDLKLLVNEIGRDFISFKIELTATSSNEQKHRQTEHDILKSILLFKNRYEANTLKT